MAHYTIEVDEQALAELKNLKRSVQVTLADAMKHHLTQLPTRETKRTIKRLNPPEWGYYRLRVGEYRIIYDVDEAAAVVRVHAIRFKGRRTFDEIGPQAGD